MKRREVANGKSVSTGNAVKKACGPSSDGERRKNKLGERISQQKKPRRQKKHLHSAQTALKRRESASQNHRSGEGNQRTHRSSPSGIIGEKGKKNVRRQDKDPCFSGDLIGEKMK